MNKKVLIAGYPKSGKTWLGYMLAYILGAKYVDRIQEPDSKPTLHKRILELIGGNLPRKSDYDSVCTTHDRYNYSSDTIGLESYDYFPTHNQFYLFQITNFEIQEVINHDQ